MSVCSSPFPAQQWQHIEQLIKSASSKGKSPHRPDPCPVLYCPRTNIRQTSGKHNCDDNKSILNEQWGRQGKIDREGDWERENARERETWSRSRVKLSNALCAGASEKLAKELLILLLLAVWCIEKEPKDPSTYLYSWIGNLISFSMQHADHVECTIMSS